MNPLVKSCWRHSYRRTVHSIYCLIEINQLRIHRRKIKSFKRTWLGFWGVYTFSILFVDIQSPTVKFSAGFNHFYEGQAVGTKKCLAKFTYQIERQKGNIIALNL